MSWSAPGPSRMVRESIPEVTRKAIRAGKLALMTPVIILVVGRWVAMIRWMPTARAFCAIRVIDSSTSRAATMVASASGGRAAASAYVDVPGLLVEQYVEEGQEVAKGDRVAIVEAMKMQTPVVSEVDGTVSSISAKIGQAVQPGDKLLKIDPSE